MSAAQARRVALAAQGFADPPVRGAVDGRALRRVLKHMGVLQIDSVNVLARAHEVPLFSRAGAYDVDRVLYQAAYRAPRRLFEYWGHAASLLPIELWPLFQWRMQQSHAWGGVRRILDENPELVAKVLADVREHGPAPASQLVPREKRSGPWWDWTDGKRALEALFWSGEVTSARRRGFERMYDLPERVIPKAIYNAPVPAKDVAQRELLRISAGALGVFTARDLRDYYRFEVDDFKARLPELLEAGDIVPVAVEGWKEQAYLDPAARIPRSLHVRALISPFDPIVWERARTERLYDFRYRIEIYVPEPQREYGYYVLPFLLGDRPVARVDLKADRANKRLLVQSAWAEPHAPAETPHELAIELGRMAVWLGLDAIVVSGRGDLAAPLAAHIG